MLVKSATLSFLWLEITGQCNLRCQHCYAGSSPSGNHGSMQLSDWLSCIEQAAGLGCKSVQFIGGEPTIYPFLKNLVYQATELEMNVEVYTNLVTVKPELWEMFRVCRVNIATSFYSIDPSVHARIVGQDSHSRTIRNIRRVVDAGLPLRVGLIEVQDGQRIKETKQFLSGLGVQRVGMDRTRGIGRGGTIVPVALPEEALCGRCAHGRAAIVPSGEVYPCVFSRHLTIGNVHAYSLADILSSQCAIETRNDLQAFFAQRAGTRCTPNCDPNGCNPVCEPGSCNPDKCQPDSLCIPDFKDPCSPAKPCEPMESPCTPDMVCGPDGDDDE